ncbi:nuclease-like protein [Ureibacillus xyleni]|uniref:Nuclease-like protein n=1 Tax=Ureibacillus xyleni TaxID=614648 RepID=A0A285SXZ2_9BACL|nr:nuclease-related domain-containing protein [Ureibacillus xyleni]SOC11665.1 nuclease-like protein [Ureibacillus xyleni]
MFNKLVSVAKNLMNLPVKKSSFAIYKEETGNGLLSTIYNKGNYGEFLSYKELATLPGYHRALFNIYLPKGEKTTEIDLVYIHETGIYVIESKNYSGWIFGDEKNRSWTQTMPNGKKYQFYNPIWQNHGHVRALQGLLPSISKDHYQSLIVFSERCTLKKVNYDSPHTYVVNRYDLKKVLSKQMENSLNVLERDQIDKVYNFLSQYSKVDNTIKSQHVQNLKEK